MIAATKFAWGRMLQTIAVGLVLLAGYSAAKMFGPEFEQTFFPIVSGPYEIVHRTDNPDGTITIRFTAHRHRQCSRVDSQWYVLDAGAWRRVDVTVSGLPLNRPEGLNVSPRNTLPGPGLYRLHVDYDCGWPWWSYAEMGAFDLRT